MRTTQNKKSVVVVGGGTGSVSVLRGLKCYKDIRLTAIVSMLDDGGSNRVIRDEFGLLPMSDVRKSLLALANDKENELIRNLLMYRFDKGIGLSGHTLGNLIMTALTDVSGSEEKAIKILGKFLGVHGRVIPVSYEKARLIANYADGEVILGEHEIDEPKNPKQEDLVSVYTIPKIKANPKAIKALMNSDFIIIGPGDLYTTTVATLLAKGIPEAIKQSKAKIVLIMNIMTKLGQTRQKAASEIVSEIEKYAGRVPDYVLVNNSPLPTDGLKNYAEIGEYPIPLDILDSENNFKILEKPLLTKEIFYRSTADNLVRSLIRHDATLVAKALYEIISK